MRRDRVAQRRAERIDQATLDAGRRDDEFTLLADDAAVCVGPFNDDGLDRTTRMTLREMWTPTDIETAVRRLQRRHRDAALSQQWHPGGIAAQHRPTTSTQREHDGIGAHTTLAIRMCETQSAPVTPTEPTVVHMEADAIRTQAPHPTAQQWRRFQIEREYATGTAHKSFNTQFARPRAHSGRIELRKPASDFAATRAIACEECVGVFRMRQVQTALAGDEKFAPDRAQAIVELHVGTGRTRDLRRHQSGWAATDDRYAGRAYAILVHHPFLRFHAAWSLL